MKTNEKIPLSMVKEQLSYYLLMKESDDECHFFFFAWLKVQESQFLCWFLLFHGPSHIESLYEIWNENQYELSILPFQSTNSSIFLDFKSSLQKVNDLKNNNNYMHVFIIKLLIYKQSPN